MSSRVNRNEMRYRGMASAGKKILLLTGCVKVKS